MARLALCVLAGALALSICFAPAAAYTHPSEGASHRAQVACLAIGASWVCVRAIVSARRYVARALVVGARTLLTHLPFHPAMQSPSCSRSGTSTSTAPRHGRMRWPPGPCVGMAMRVSPPTVSCSDTMRDFVRARPGLRATAPRPACGPAGSGRGPEHLFPPSPLLATPPALFPLPPTPPRPLGVPAPRQLLGPPSRVRHRLTTSLGLPRSVPSRSARPTLATLSAATAIPAARDGGRCVFSPVAVSCADVLAGAGSRLGPSQSRRPHSGRRLASARHPCSQPRAPRAPSATLRSSIFPHPRRTGTTCLAARSPSSSVRNWSRIACDRTHRTPPVSSPLPPSIPCQPELLRKRRAEDVATAALVPVGLSTLTPAVAPVGHLGPRITLQSLLRGFSRLDRDVPDKTVAALDSPPPDSPPSVLPDLT